MISNMEEKKRPWLFLAMIIISCLLVAILSGWWALNYKSVEPYFIPKVIPDTYLHMPGDFEFYYFLNTVLSSVNIVLVSALLVMHIIFYQKNKSNFVLGLILFATALLLYTFASNPIIIDLFGFEAFGLGPFALLPTLFTTISFSIMLYLTFE